MSSTDVFFIAAIEFHEPVVGCLRNQSKTPFSEVFLIDLGHKIPFPMIDSFVFSENLYF